MIDFIILLILMWIEYSPYIIRWFEEHCYYIWELYIILKSYIDNTISL